jgi:hypothetical protein
MLAHRRTASKTGSRHRSHSALQAVPRISHPPVTTSLQVGDSSWNFMVSSGQPKPFPHNDPAPNH